MSSEHPHRSSPLARSGALIALGLAVQAFTLFSLGPMPFMLYAGVGASLVLLGIADYLWTIVRASPAS